jgi:hypothetical protein
MSDEDSNFVAKGIEVHGFVSAFVDEGTEILEHGVNVQGSICGVYGESQDLRPDMSGPPRTNTTRSTPEGRIGVYGVGDYVGVYGDNGVYGRKLQDSGYGVNGEAPHVGVRGAGGHAGVEGWGDEGAVGGVFGAHTRAQLRLEPSPYFRQPQRADAGDLLFIKRPDAHPEDASLWLCVNGTNPEMAGAERWREIQLGPVQKEPAHHVSTWELIKSWFTRFTK